MSEMFDYVLDPDGDMKLILEHANAEFAPWLIGCSNASNEIGNLADEVQPTSQQAKIINKSGLHSDDDHRSLSSSYDPHHEQDDVQSHKSSSTVAFRISSRHLRLASERSRGLRSDAWTDDVQSDGLIHITLEDWDPEALHIVLNIIHNRNRSVPTTVSLEMMAKIAVIVDYFKFHEAIEPFTNGWMAGLDNIRPEAYCRDLILRIWISYVFGDDKGLAKSKAVAVVDGVGPIADLGLPIPERILDEIRRNIEDVTAYIDLELRQLRAGYESGSFGCSQECRYGALGAMWMHLHHYGVFEARTMLSDYSIASIYRTLREPRTSEYSKKKRAGRLCCGLNTIVKPLTEGIEHRVGPEIKKTVVGKPDIEWSPWEQ